MSHYDELKMSHPMTRLHVFTALPISILFITCNTESVAPIMVSYNGLVDQRLIPYFRTFEAEAAARGVLVDFDEFPVSASIESIPNDDIAGTCNYHYYEPNVVTIDLEFWNAVPTLRREMIVFHELGHCYLGRGHLETAFNNGICTTIMNSGTSGCYVAYTVQNRDYYLDELFEIE